MPGKAVFRRCNEPARISRCAGRRNHRRLFLCLLFAGAFASAKRLTANLDSDLVVPDVIRSRLRQQHILRPRGPIVICAAKLLRQLLQLGVGDVIPLSTRVGDPLVAPVQGRPKFLGHVGKRGSFAAFKVASILES